MPASHYSVFYRPDALLAAQPTPSKHWRQLEQLWFLAVVFTAVQFSRCSGCTNKNDPFGNMSRWIQNCRIFFIKFTQFIQSRIQTMYAANFVIVFWFDVKIINCLNLKVHFSKWTRTTTFYGPLSGTTQVSLYQKKHSPTHTYTDHQPSFISFLYLLWSIASSLFNLRAWKSFCTTPVQVLFGLPLGLVPPTSYSIHFFTQSLSSFHNTCPCHNISLVRIVMLMLFQENEFHVTLSWLSLGEWKIWLASNLLLFKWPISKSLLTISVRF